jgi:hypothetical protein
MKITRRAMAAVLASVGAQAQTPALAVQPAASPEAELESAREQVKANVTALAQFEVPMSTEPSFEFKA